MRITFRGPSSSRLLLAFTAACTLAAADSQKSAPDYAAAGIVNAASYMPDALAPNAIASVFGSDLAYDTTAAPPNVPDHMLPVELSGVRVYVGGINAPLYYVSPKQINFVIPGDLLTGDCDFFIARQGTSGPHVKITVREAGPGLFQRKAAEIAAWHAGGGPVTQDNPAKAGEVVVLLGTGLGRTQPLIPDGLISLVPAQIQDLKDFHVSVAGVQVDPSSVRYAGAAPGTPGLYPVTVKLPAQLTPNPEIRLSIGGQISPAGTKLSVR